MCRSTGDTPRHQSEIGVEFNPFIGQHLADPYLVYRRARCEEPVFFSTALQAWCITKYEDVVRVLTDSERFRSPDDMSASLGFSYDWVRRGVNRAFAPTQMLELTTRLRGVAHRLVDQFVDRGIAEFGREFSKPFPLRVTLSMLGAPEDDESKLRQWGNDWMASRSCDLSNEQDTQAAAGVLEFRQYLSRLIDGIDRRTDVAEMNLLSCLVWASREEKDPPGRESLVNACAVMAIAGHETTTKLLNICLYRILNDPGQQRQVFEDRDLVARMVEETLRFDTPLQAVPRITSMPVEIAGVCIPEGARIAAFVASANHDETHFACPEQFDLRRQDVMGHLSFGRGARQCAGAKLARLEVLVALETVMERLPELRLAPGHTVDYEIDRIYRGPKEIRIHWKVGS